jgi:hypothetical protein
MGNREKSAQVDHCPPLQAPQNAGRSHRSRNLYENRISSEEVNRRYKGKPDTDYI